MALITLNGTVEASDLLNNYDDLTSTLAANAILGQCDQPIFVFVRSLAAATALSLRTVAFALQDDAEVRICYGYGTADAIGRLLTVTLAVDNGDATYLVNNTITATVTSAGAGLTHTRPTLTDLTDTAGTRVRLKKGVRYRLTVSTDAGTYTDAVGGIVLRSVRRAQ